jgi:hypothetical protein
LAQPPRLSIDFGLGGISDSTGPTTGSIRSRMTRSGPSTFIPQKRSRLNSRWSGSSFDFVDKS